MRILRFAVRSVLSFSPMRRFVLALGAVFACSDTAIEEAPLVVEEGCQPLLAGTAADTVSQATCILPYPSDFHREGDRYVLRGKAKLHKTDGTIADPHDGYVTDGASTIPAIVATLPSVLSRDGLQGITADPTTSQRPESTTVLIEADTGAFIAHYTDLHEDDDDGKHSGIVLRPLAPLKPRTRYVAALAGVKTAEGSAAPPAEGFRRMREKRNDASFESRVFAVLEKAGVARERLQLAWDFTTGSEEHARADMGRVVELTRAWLASSTPAISVTSTADDRVELSIELPFFLGDEGGRARLARDASGAVMQNGMTKADVLVVIPPAIRDGVAPGRALAFGHGFFGGRGEAEGGPGRTISNRLGAVLFATDWRGMAKNDVVGIADTFSQTPERVGDFAERVHQAMANWIVVTHLVKTRFADLPELRRKDGGPLWDPTFVGYFGASQGHILGGTLSAIDTDIQRAVLNVGGGGFVHIMPRSGAFGAFALVLRSTFPDSLSRLLFTSMMQPALDRLDPLTFAPMLGDRALLQVGLGDNAVPCSAGFLHARAIGAKQMMPAPQKIFGLEETTGGASGSTITLFDYHLENPNDFPLPQSPNMLHDVLRTNEAALKQMDAFLKPDGVAVHPCDGPCDPL
jgi:hypothetical protein